jgi:outer membrane murein-binding lipoprotein Lpp
MQSNQPFVPALRPESRNPIARSIFVVGFGLLLTGCATTEGQQQLDAQLTALQAQLDSVSTELARTRADIAEREAASGSVNAALAADVAGIGTRLEQLPDELAKLCPAVPAP